MVLVWGSKLTVALVAPLTPVIVTGSPLGSVSLASSADAEICSAVFCTVEKPLSLAATGGWLGGGCVTLSATVAEAVPPRPSEIAYVKPAAPVSSFAGVTLLELIWASKRSVPLVAPLTPVIVNGSPLGSVSLASSADAEICNAVFCTVEKPLSFWATGASFGVGAAG